MSAPLLTPAAYRVVGTDSGWHELPPARGVDIDAYRFAIGDANPRYASATDGTQIAPLDFCQVYRLPLAALDELGEDGLPLRRWGIPRLPIAAQRILFGGTELEFFGHVAAGDVLQRRTVVSDVYEKQGASGPAVFLVTETTYARTTPGGDREIVTTARETLIYR